MAKATAKELTRAIKRAAKFAMDTAPADEEKRCGMFVAYLSGAIALSDSELSTLLTAVFQASPVAVEAQK